MVIRLKKKVHLLAHYCGASTYLARRIPSARILMYHGVGGEECPVEAFEGELCHLARNFRVLSLEGALAAVAEGKGEGVVALTFDDGLRNNYRRALPLLKKHGIPATFFVCPGLVEQGAWLWNHEARQRLKLLDDRARCELTAPFGAALGRTEEVVDWMKRLPQPRRKEMEAAIRTRTPHFAPTPAEREEFDLMTWEELESLPPDLITVGAHTTHHDILDSLDGAGLVREIAHCRQILEDRLERPVRYFCYPNGVSNPDVVALVRSEYRAAVTTEPGFVARGDDPYLLNRIEGAADVPYFAWRLYRPAS